MKNILVLFLTTFAISQLSQAAGAGKKTLIPDQAKKPGHSAQANREAAPLENLTTEQISAALSRHGISSNHINSSLKPIQVRNTKVVIDTNQLLMDSIAKLDKVKKPSEEYSALHITVETLPLLVNKTNSGETSPGLAGLLRSGQAIAKGEVKDVNQINKYIETMKQIKDMLESDSLGEFTADSALRKIVGEEKYKRLSDCD